MTTPRKPRANTRGKPFAAGNPGKPKGTRSRATMAAEALLDGEAEGLTRKAVDLALEGDTVALRLCLERLVPPRRDRPIIFDLPAVGSAPTYRYVGSTAKSRDGWDTIGDLGHYEDHGGERFFFLFPALGSAADHPAALSAVIAAVAAGELTPSEAEAFAGIMEQHRRAIETAEIVARLEALEGRASS